MFKYIERRSYDPLNLNLLGSLAKGNDDLIQRMTLLRSLPAHNGCVNSVIWDDEGKIILSGSDDQHLVISDPWYGKTLYRLPTAHRQNIFCAKFLPQSGNQKIVSCSGDGMIIYTDLNSPEKGQNCKFNCYTSTCYDILTLPACPHSFLSCGEDGTVRWFDLRTKTSCSNQVCREDILLNMGQPVTAIAANPITQTHLAVATPDSTIRIYDRRMLGTRAQDTYLAESNKALLMHLKPESMDGNGHRVTSLRYSSKGDQVLASYSSDYVYLFDTENAREVPLESRSSSSQDDDDRSPCGGPTLKRLRLRGDWSDTGPQAVPESELRNQAEDVGQARPTLQSTLMQRMTNILARLLQSPSTRSAATREPPLSEAVAADAEDDRTESPLRSSEDIANAEGREAADANQVRETNSVSPVADSVPPVPSVPTPQEEPILVAMESPEVPDANEIRQPSKEPHSASEKPLDSSEPMEVVGGSEQAREDGVEPVVERPLGSSLQSTVSGVDDSPSSLQEDFKHKQSVEPSDNILYSGEGTSSGVLSVTAKNEMERDQQDVRESNNDDVQSSVHDLRTTAADLQDQSVPAAGAEEVITVPAADAGEVPAVSAVGAEEATAVPDAGAREEPVVPAAGTEEATAVPDAGAREEPAGAGDAGAVGEVVDESTILAHPLKEGEDCGTGESTSSASASASAKSLQGPSGKRKSPRRDSSPRDQDSEDDNTTRRRSASSRMAKAIDRVVQRVRGEEARRIDGPPDRSIPRATEAQQYKGHRNARTMIKEVCFWGEDHVMSGSDCGRVFVWERKRGRLVMLWEADRHVVNCLQPHPHLPILATSGIDYDVKLWAPIAAESRFDPEQSAEISRRNEALLTETRDTITVPATFMIRMLASLNQLRHDRNRNRGQNQDEEEGDDDVDDEEEEDC